MLLLIDLALFYTPGVLFSISLATFCKQIIEAYVYPDATLKFYFEKLKPAIFNNSLQSDTSIYIVHLKAYANHLPGVQVMAIISLQ